MAIPGRAPIEGEKAGRYTSPFDSEKVEVSSPSVDVPELYARHTLLPQTLAWWDTWASAPQNSVFTSTDWQRLQMLAPFVDLYFRSLHSADVKPSTLSGMLAEIRQNEGLLGATHVDRLKGRIKVADPAADSEHRATLTVIDEYRAALGEE